MSEAQQQAAKPLTPEQQAMIDQINAQQGKLSPVASQPVSVSVGLAGGSPDAQAGYGGLSSPNVSSDALNNYGGAQTPSQPPVQEQVNAPVTAQFYVDAPGMEAYANQVMIGVPAQQDVIQPGFIDQKLEDVAGVIKTGGVNMGLEASKQKAGGGDALAGVLFAGSIAAGAVGAGFDVATFFARPKLVGETAESVAGLITDPVGSVQRGTKAILDAFSENPGFTLGYVGASTAIAVGGAADAIIGSRNPAVIQELTDIKVTPAVEGDMRGVWVEGVVGETRVPKSIGGIVGGEGGDFTAIVGTTEGDLVRGYKLSGLSPENVDAIMGGKRVFLTDATGEIFATPPTEAKLFVTKAGEHFNYGPVSEEGSIISSKSVEVNPKVIGVKESAVGGLKDFKETGFESPFREDPIVSGKLGGVGVVDDSFRVKVIGGLDESEDFIPDLEVNKVKPEPGIKTSLNESFGFGAETRPSVSDQMKAVGDFKDANEVMKGGSGPIIGGGGSASEVIGESSLGIKAVGRVVQPPAVGGSVGIGVSAGLGLGRFTPQTPKPAMDFNIRTPTFNLFSPADNRPSVPQSQEPIQRPTQRITSPSTQIPFTDTEIKPITGITAFTKAAPRQWSGLDTKPIGDIGDRSVADLIPRFDTNVKSITRSDTRMMPLTDVTQITVPSTRSFLDTKPIQDVESQFKFPGPTPTVQIPKPNIAKITPPKNQISKNPKKKARGKRIRTGSEKRKHQLKSPWELF